MKNRNSALIWSAEILTIWKRSMITGDIRQETLHFEVWRRFWEDVFEAMTFWRVWAEMNFWFFWNVPKKGIRKHSVNVWKTPAHILMKNQINRFWWSSLSESLSFAPGRRRISNRWSRQQISFSTKQRNTGGSRYGDRKKLEQFWYNRHYLRTNR